jgi:hypothetical protein
MDVVIARAFLHPMLSFTEREELKALEASFPPRRLLQGFEVCRKFKLQPAPRTDAQIASMEETRKQFQKLLWKDRQANFREDFPDNPEEMRIEINGFIGPDDLQAWLIYSMANYKEPQRPNERHETDAFMNLAGQPA